MNYDEMRPLFAALAMNGLLGENSPHADEIVHPTGRPDETHAENLARDAVQYADALIAALKL